ncbi:MAG: RNA polymerase factor sigma-32 [Desulfomonile tiedjei]|uniref:RNA polymerase factor sigma-32 n=1 Tax=Desulfomonile tiedjei TaxID=2358 RepID=A0A9D6V1K3_9BACT|nr:RNA polymerase factor sigma-32 [Desulfomonile tiedjei]
MNYPVLANQLDQFLAQVRAIKPLTPEQEHELAVDFKETGSVEAAHQLVVSHLPFVVKTAFQYRHYRIPVLDLIQEGSIGLMKAVKRFDPYKGYRLVSFAVWWIKAYIKNYILKTWSLVKLGTTQAQRKLFFRIGDIGEHMDADSKSARIDDLASELSVKSDDVIEMEARVKSREWSLNEPMGSEKETSPMDILEDHAPDQEMILIERESEEELSSATKQALQKLDPRERFIVTKRFMDDSPWTLQKLGDYFGTSRERVRQLEKRALTKLRNEFSPELVERASEV